jgi:hypothetical protein
VIWRGVRAIRHASDGHGRSGPGETPQGRVLAGDRRQVGARVRAAGSRADGRPGPEIAERDGPRRAEALLDEVARPATNAGCVPSVATRIIRAPRSTHVSHTSRSRSHTTSTTVSIAAASSSANGVTKPGWSKYWRHPEYDRYAFVVAARTRRWPSRAIRASSGEREAVV